MLSFMQIAVTYLLAKGINFDPLLIEHRLGQRCTPLGLEVPQRSILRYFSVAHAGIYHIRQPNMTGNEQPLNTPCTNNIGRVAQVARNFMNSSNVTSPLPSASSA